MNLERQIDELAREMTAVKTDVPLRARVLARIDEPRRTRPFTPLVVVAAAAVLVAAGVSVWLARSPLAETSGGVARSDHAPLVSIEPAPVPDHAAPAAPAATPDTIHLAVVQPASEGSAAWRARSVPALTVPAALVVPAIQPRTIAIPLLDMAPLTSDPLGVRPIGSVLPIEAGNQTGDS